MLPKRPLNQLLPVRFRNGEQIRQFSKPCVRCGHMLNARDMQGAARLVDENQLAIAAAARCPQCGERFGVACLVDEQKRVRRVLVPAALFGWYLRSLPPQKGEQSQLHTVAMDDLRDADLTVTEAQSAPVPAPTRQQDVVRADQALGQYQGKPIPAWVEVDGVRLDFERVAPGAQPTQDEFLLDGCLLYRGAR
ncbi:hypothetical protein [Chitinolyticbacter meiyuanensis]|uniref:hypothetical protein n=1 Tax=Chitinolyticbacter meiyuanensis TaxID=682798 RepID=UPI0011E5F5A7|nr:hypothetical protein [Chitinolyticbacter meiyuanensis]